MNAQNLGIYDDQINTKISFKHIFDYYSLIETDVAFYQMSLCPIQIKSNANEISSEKNTTNIPNKHKCTLK